MAQSPRKARLDRDKRAEKSISAKSTRLSGAGAAAVAAERSGDGTHLHFNGKIERPRIVEGVGNIRAAPWRLTFRRGFAKNLTSFDGAFRASLERKQGTPWIEEGWHRSEPWHANVYTVECFARIRGRRQTSELHARRGRTLRDANGH